MSSWKIGHVCRLTSLLSWNDSDKIHYLFPRMEETDKTAFFEVRLHLGSQEGNLERMNCPWKKRIYFNVFWINVQEWRNRRLINHCHNSAIALLLRDDITRCSIHWPNVLWGNSSFIVFYAPGITKRMFEMINNPSNVSWLEEKKQYLQSSN